jgi:nucleotide-binding universal stress UspA family protein
MQFLSRILLPVDFSERSVGGAHYAGSLACHFGCELVLLHVLAPPQYEFGAVDIAGSMLAELCRDRALQAKTDLAGFQAADFARINVRRVVLEGDPSGSIVDFAHQERTDTARSAASFSGRTRPKCCTTPIVRCGPVCI